MKRLGIVAIAIMIVLSGSALSLADDGSGGGRGGFFQGLFGPIILLLQTTATLLDPAGSVKFAVLWEKTWGQGSTSYRLGFVAGAITLLTVFGGLGGGATKAATKKDEQKADQK